ncbi:hypothetical protein Bca52824_070196 [Brassica carinata]|uniref:GrpE protein homolog n=1 Tax=Brassica carinata TaxID=52824 RepID=A0A8X7U215_BRACI|nr:hypothetical protein Bca52824_070196 [Brassica carinata]
MDTVEEGKQPLLITVTHNGDVPELRSIPSESANTSRWSFLFKLLLVITTIGVSTAGIALIILITPTPPTVHIHSMHIAFNEGHLSIWSATFSIKNGNDKLRVTYESPSVWVFHRSKHVGMVRIGSFWQRGGDANEVVVKGDETGEDVAMTGSVVGLDMVFLGRVGFYPGASTVWGKQNMTAVCKNVKAMLSTDDDDKLNKTKSWGLTFDDRQDCRVRYLVNLPSTLIAFFPSTLAFSSLVFEASVLLSFSFDSAGAAPLLKILFESVEVTEKQLAEVFKKFGMEKYDPINEPFDPNRHNAVFQVPDASKPEGTVAHVLKSGYTLFDRVIRPAEVGVTQGGESQEDKKEPDA